MDSAKIAQLKAFIQLCDSNPSVLQDPSLRFFRNYLEKLDAKLPPSAYGKSETSKADQGEESDDDMPELEEQSRNFKFSSDSSDADEESEVELDNSDVVDPDNDSPQQMGDATIEVTEEMRDNAQIAKGKAMDAIAEGDLDTAVSCLTEAILANPSSAILYANRAGIYVKMKKPNAAVRDADAAIKINPDSAKGYKWRGQANAMLGHWEDAAKDLHLASRLDYDEEIAFVLKKVEPNVHKIEEHRRKYQRLRREHELKKAARSKAKKERQFQHEHQHQHQHGPQCQHGHQHQHETKKPEAAAGQGASGMPGGGFPGAMPGGIDISKILSDPELLAAFQDPEVMAALQDVMKNPANLAKHQGNPKVAPFIAKMMSKVGGHTG